MDSLLQLRQEFRCAAMKVEQQECLLERPSIMIEDKTFQGILTPVREIMEGEAIYSNKQKFSVPDMLEELRKMCLEAQTSHTTKDGSTRERRTELLNILQSIKEQAEEGVDANGMCMVDMDFFYLPRLTDVIREAAMTHSEFLHNSEISEALMHVADNIEVAEKRLWTPVNAADNDYNPPMYGTQLTPAEKTETTNLISLSERQYPQVSPHFA
ncbi:MAG: hypothetical protein KAJ40_02155 [Alphaproteobacteria bacterium]|nr:hypothetical protein [Alphaproteobacteria bacterium]